MKKNNTNKKNPPLPEISAGYDNNGTVGSVLRFAVLLTAVFGINLLASEILKLSVGFFPLLFSTLFFFSVLYFSFRSFKGLIISSVIALAVGVIYCSSKDVTPVDVVVRGFVGIFNATLDMIRSFNFLTIPSLPLEGADKMGILILISFVSSLTVALSCRRKTRVLPYLILSLLIIVGYIALGGLLKPWQYIIPVCSVCALAVMGKSDGQTKSERSSYLGILSFLLAGLMLLTPIVNTKKAMEAKDIIGDMFDFISGIGGMLVGPSEGGERDPNLNERDVRPSKRDYKNKEIMRVFADNDRALYLRTWAGGSYSNETWKTVQYAAGISSYDITENFLIFAERVGYDPVSLGLTVSDSGVQLLTKQSLLPMPSMSDRPGKGIEERLGEIQIVNKNDGMIHLSSPFKGDYRVTSLNADGGESFARVLSGYREFLELYVKYWGLGDDASEEAKRFAEYFTPDNAKYALNASEKLGSFVKKLYYGEVTDPAIDRAVTEIFDYYDIEKYYERVAFQSSYDMNGLVKYKRSVYSLSEDGIAHAKDIADIVADYLSKMCEYSLDPKSDSSKGAIEDFLFYSKEGYCVQYATAGALIMRKLGFPTRYAEGYIAKDFSGKEGNYNSKVTDRNAHAWIEIWVDGFGWMTAEMTPGYSNDGVPPPDSETEPWTAVSTTPPTTTAPTTTDSESTDVTMPPVTTETDPVTSKPTTSPATTTEEDEAGETAKKKKKTAPMPFIIGVVVTAAVSAAVGYAISVAKKNSQRLSRLTDRIKRGGLNSAEKRKYGALLAAALTEALKTYRLLPRVGELPEAYGERLESSLDLEGLSFPLSSCVEALSRQVYGFGMEENDLLITALALDAMRKGALKKLGAIRFVIGRLRGAI